MDPTTPNIAAGAQLAPAAPRNDVKATSTTAGTDDKRAAQAASPEQEAALQRDPRSLQYQVDGHRVITTIIDENDKTVVVQIPDAEMIRIAKSIDRMQGFLVKSKA